MMNIAKLIWSTPNAEQLLADIARVSAPDRQGMEPTGLIRFLMRNKHWSPFEMVSMCVEINTTRTVSRQILRHRSFSFQEFSGRWSPMTELSAASTPVCRLQNPSDRAQPLSDVPAEVDAWWRTRARALQIEAEEAYRAALGKGIAREVARSVLPEGLTPTRLYMAGTFRSWLHYLQLRLKPDTQLEHRDVAKAIQHQFVKVAPITWAAGKEGLSCC